MVVSAAAGPRDVPMQVGVTVDLDPPEQSKRKASKRGADTALSPGHLANALPQATAGARRPQHLITGVDRDFRENVKQAITSLELTRDVKVLQCVMDQVTKSVTEIQRRDFEAEGSWRRAWP